MKKIIVIISFFPLVAIAQTNGYVLKNSNGTIDIADGTITNQQLQNSTITINGNAVSLGGSTSISGAGTFLSLQGNVSSSSVTRSVVSDWSFSVTSGKTYRIEIVADYQTAATTTGGSIGILLTNSAAGTVRGFAKGAISASAVATEVAVPIRTTSGTGSFLTTTGVSATSTPHFIHLLVTFTCTTSGTFNITWGSEVDASAAQLNANSSLIYTILN